MGGTLATCKCVKLKIIAIKSPRSVVMIRKGIYTLQRVKFDKLRDVKYRKVHA